MKTSVRTPATGHSSANLLWDLMRFSGDRLVLSAGYLSWFKALPFNEIVNSVNSIDLVVGTWQLKTPAETAAALALLQANVQDLADSFAQESAEYGLQKPGMHAYLVPNWHAKVALMVDTERAAVSAAIIGSSNISAPALGQFAPWSNIEADVLLCSDDGPDAQRVLNRLLEQLEPTFTGHLFARY